MNVYLSDLMSSVSEKIFSEVDAKFKVDKKNHKLTGKSLFQILLYNICEEDRISLRVIEESFQSHKFRIFHKGKPLTASKSGIASRLKKINFKYYETIFHLLYKSLSKKMSGPEKRNIKRFDSTIVTLSSKLLGVGQKVPVGNKNQMKFTVGFDGLPCELRFGTAKSDMSENISLRKTIKSATLLKSDIVVFDRGLNSRKTLAEFNKSKIQFVTRMSDKVNFKIIKKNDLPKNIKTNTLKIISDNIVNLRSRDVHWIKEEFRLIQTINLKNKQPVNFLTNMFDLSADEITDIYRLRWDIEVFFKFIKQYLNTKHFLSRDLNGIKVVFCMILIASILILTFKKLNKILSFKIAKKRFVEQLSRAVTYDIILLYRDDPQIFKQRFCF